MCTVSIIGLRDGFRLACNRDELLIRPSALRPVTRRFGDRLATFPVDPQSNGTWIAVNDAGLALALLNANPGTASLDFPSLQSRGVIIPSLLHCFDADEANEFAGAINPAEFPPFKLIAIDGVLCAQVHSDGRRLTCNRSSFDDEPFMITSSGLGDHLVEQPRRELFDRMVRPDPSAGAQDAFHSHTWPDRPHVGVMMQREDARTVSHTVIEVRGGAAQLRYTPVPFQQLQPI